MSIFSTLFSRRPDDRAALRPLWHRVVAIAREKQWYDQLGVADSVAGRFDAVTMVLALVMLRMENDPALVSPAARLTELFVTDMDGQLRESGVGDLMVGKKIGRLMAVLGGRLGAYRDGLAGDDAGLAAAVARNVSLLESSDPAALVSALRQLCVQLDSINAQALLAGEITR